MAPGVLKLFATLYIRVHVFTRYIPVFIVCIYWLLDFSPTLLFGSRSVNMSAASLAAALA